MIVPRDKIEGLLAGRITGALYTREPAVHPGGSYAIQSRVGGPEVCRVLVLRAPDEVAVADLSEEELGELGYRRDDDWGWTNGGLVWRARFVLDLTDRSRYLANRSGTTTDPKRAMGRRYVPGHGFVVEEPEPVPSGWLDRETGEIRDGEREGGHERIDEICRDPDLGSRLSRLQLEAARLGVDTRSEARLARRLVEQGRPLLAPCARVESKIRARFSPTVGA